MRLINDELQECTGTESYAKYLGEQLLSDGAVKLAEKGKCWWLLDIICSVQSSFRQKLFKADFQCWKFTKTGKRGAVVCTDGNDNILYQQEITSITFEYDMAELWWENSVIYLPSEH